jgi:hypothetical protein
MKLSNGPSEIMNNNMVDANDYNKVVRTYLHILILMSNTFPYHNFSYINNIFFVTRTPLKTGGELKGSTSSSTTDICRVSLVANPVIMK